jgi:hypothetical protein
LNETRLKPVVDAMAADVDENGWKTLKNGGGISMFGSKKSGTGAGLNTPKDVSEDIRITAKTFNNLMTLAVKFDITGPLPMQGKIENPFTSEVAPNVCVKITPVAEAPTTGGRRTRKRKVTHKRGNKRNKKTRRH